MGGFALCPLRGFGELKILWRHPRDPVMSAMFYPPLCSTESQRDERTLLSHCLWQPPLNPPEPSYPFSKLHPGGSCHSSFLQIFPFLWPATRPLLPPQEPMSLHPLSYSTHLSYTVSPPCVLSQSPCLASEDHLGTLPAPCQGRTLSRQTSLLPRHELLS